MTRFFVVAVVSMMVLISATFVISSHMVALSTVMALSSEIVVSHMLLFVVVSAMHPVPRLHCVCMLPVLLVVVHVMLSMVLVVVHEGLAWVTLSVIILFIRALLKEFPDIFSEVLYAMHNAISDGLQPVFYVTSAVFQIVFDMAKHSLVRVLPITSNNLLVVVWVVHAV
jgi:hypothetical protein